MSFIENIEKQLLDSAALKQELATIESGQIEIIANLLIEAIKKGNKLLICGNGGSASDAQHFAAELIGRYKLNRKAMPAIALTTDTSILTSIGNDFGVESIFQKQVEGLGQPGDVLIGISTSGNSKNVVKAFEQAKLNKVICVAFIGGQTCTMESLADYSIRIPSADTPRIQECHGTVIHIICDLIESTLFGSAL